MAIQAISRLGKTPTAADFWLKLTDHQGGLRNAG